MALIPPRSKARRNAYHSLLAGACAVIRGIRNEVAGPEAIFTSVRQGAASLFSLRLFFLHAKTPQLLDGSLPLPFTLLSWQIGQTVRVRYLRLILLVLLAPLVQPIDSRQRVFDRPFPLRASIEGPSSLSRAASKILLCSYSYVDSGFLAIRWPPRTLTSPSALSNPQTGLLIPGGYTTRFGPSAPQNLSHEVSKKS